MRIEGNHDRNLSQPQSLNEEVNLVSLSDRTSQNRQPATDSTIQLAHIGTDLAVMASSLALSCDVLFESRTQCNKLNKVLSDKANPASREIGELLNGIMSRGLGNMQQRVERLNDYLNGEIGPRTGFQASWDAARQRITLTQIKTGTSASYAVQQIGDKTIVNPIPVAQTYRVRR